MSLKATDYELPLPAFYNPARRDEFFQPNLVQLVHAARPYGDPKHALYVPPAYQQTVLVEALTIDPNIDFLSERGMLSCWANTKDEINRAAEFFYRNAGVISTHRITLDAHHLLGHLHSAFLFVDTKTGLPPGCPADPNGPWYPTAITIDEYRSGRYLLASDAATIVFGDAVGTAQAANYQSWLLRVVDYVIEQTPMVRGGAPHMVWPPHSLLGGMGQATQPQLWEAMCYYQILRRSPLDINTKGLELVERFNPWATVLINGPSVEQPTAANPDPEPSQIGEENKDQVMKLMQADLVLALGWCGSHCFRDGMLYIIEQAASNPEVKERVYVLEDLIAAVPGFEAAREEAIRLFKAAGCHVVKSTVPICEWDGVAPSVIEAVVAERNDLAQRARPVR